MKEADDKMRKKGNTNITGGQVECQIFSVPRMCYPLSVPNVLWQRRNRFKRIFKRRWNYLNNLFKEKTGEKSSISERTANKSKSARFQAGDIVRVKSEENIRTTLDHWNMLKGCGFMEEMRPYCNTAQRVLKPVGKFLDERDYLMKKCKGIVILDGVFCEGTKDFGSCDRTCYFFWREEWLEKID